MDRALPATIVRKRKFSRIAIAAGVVVVAIIAFLLLRSLISPTLDRSKLRTAVAELGRIDATISAAGVVVPEFEQTLTSLIQTRVDSVFLKTGDRVKKGQQILQLNLEGIKSDRDRLKDELEMQKARKQGLLLELKRNEIELDAQYEIKQLEVKFSESQLERERQLLAAGASNKSNVERAQLDLEIAQRQLGLLSDQIANQKASLDTEIKSVDLEIRIRENSLAETERRLRLAETRADRDGIITWVNDNIGASVNVGDAIARIADLGSYKVEASISDIHADKLLVAGPVTVRINDRNLDGRIASVQPAVENGVMTFVVELDRKDDSLLRPNLRADVFVITDSRDSVLRVANGPFYRGTVDQPVFVIDGDKAVRRTVDIGATNYDYVELVGSISVGDEVIISSMWDYRHMEEVKLNDR